MKHAMGAKDPLPALQLPKKRPLWQRRFDVLGWHYVEWAHTFLVFGRGSMISLRYRDKILECYIRLFRGAVSSDFILMNNNARSHELF